MMVEGEEFVEVGIFPEEGVRPHRSSGEKGGSLPVSSELLNMLVHVTPGRWLRGNFFRVMEFVLVGLPVKMGEFVRKFQVTKSLLHVTLGRWWRGGFIRWFSRGGLVHSLLRSLMIC